MTTVIEMPVTTVIEMPVSTVIEMPVSTVIEPAIRADERLRFLEAAKDFPEPYRTIIAQTAGRETWRAPAASDCSGTMITTTPAGPAGLPLSGLAGPALC